ncbi:carbamoyltransferase HypF [Ramlibacter sp. AN1133]|uniref:carbamoyltransferase HypF n=1 Tax=Ramlibacter sp. AN1133 TaxID=3133429 RepID=UPI0030BD27A7
MTCACRIRVTGIVQGVGFRPFVWRLAQELNVSGWVRNDAAGVEIAAEGAATQLGTLLERLRDEAPALARVDSVQRIDSPPQRFSGFVIADSAGGHAATAIGPDVATCPDCLAELFDPGGRRWRHAFITCTHCGPRYTVTQSLPYDRTRTSLAPFPLCPACAREYGAPADRRFHAETTCCPRCGPHLALIDDEGAVPGDAIAATLRLLRAGSIVAIKSLGGFHLACDARNAQAVARLRLRKNREAKPFAVMAANAQSLEAIAPVPAPARGWLESAERPVVLLDAPSELDATLPGVAPGLRTLGAMLPATPIQFLLFHEAAGRPSGLAWLEQEQPLLLVMTSANPGGEPIVRGNAEARERLATIADAILDHDREIVARCDDSVVRPQGAAGRFVRRSRGYAPASLRLPAAGPSVISFGAHLKNSVCVTRGDEAFLSPHVGDLDNAATCTFQAENVQRMLGLLQARPDVVAHDLHPEDHASQAALAFAAEHGLRTHAVQHHHAHIAATCAEHGWRAPVLGLALDGVGLGTDATAWGGELLQVQDGRFDRLGHLRPLPLPGGDRAARQPWRMAAAVLHLLGRGDQIAARFAQEPASGAMFEMLRRGVNCPQTTSMGRVFDAAAGLLGLCAHMQYEAEAAMRLEQAAHGRQPEPLWCGWHIDADGVLDLLPLLASLADERDARAGAARFHATLAAALADWLRRASILTDIRTIAFGGGCFLNTQLSLQLADRLEHEGLRVLQPERLPPGDGGLALGQAWVAMQALQGDS